MTAVVYADKEPADNGPRSVNPLFQRPGTGDLIKDLDLYTEDGKVAPPKTADVQRSIPASTILGEDFETAVPPAGWTLNSTNSGDYTWHQTFSASLSGFAGAEVVYDPALAAQDEWLATPVMSFVGTNPADLRVDFGVFTSYYWSVSPYDNYDVELWISTDGGATFPTMLWDETALGVFTSFVWYEVSVPLAAYAGESNVVLAWRYVGSDGAQAVIDLVNVNDDPPPVGRCCYGDPLSPTCSDETAVDCAALGGTWDETLSCSTDPCPIAGVGDECSAPLTVALPAPGGYPYTIANQFTCGRGNTYSETCLGSYDGGEDIIIEIQVPANVTLDITFDPKGTTWSGMLIDDACPPDASTCLGTVTGSGGTPKSIYAVNLAAGTYYIMVDTWPSPDCVPDFDITFAEAAGAPANDLCIDAEAIGEVTNYPFTTVAAGNDGGGVCMTSPNVWYVYTPSISGTATISLCGSSYDTRMAVYDGYSCGPLPVELACNDDACGLQSEITLPVIGGQQYLIEVGGYSSNFGTGVISTSVVTPPPNDNCEDAVVQTTFPAVINGDNTGASNQCSSFPGNHVWEAFTLTGDASVTLSYEGTTPAFENAWLNLALDCPCTGLADGFTYGGSYTFAPDGNVEITWGCLKAGTYYYPVLQEPGATGPYTITIDVNYYAGGCYCPAQSNSAAYEYISRVELVDIDNASGASNYSDFTALQTTLYIGRTYQATVEVGSGYSTDEGWLFIDWNNDFDFDDAGETIAMAGSPGAGPYTATLVPPVGSVEAPTRMRVRMFDGYYNAPAPCGNTSYGEVEDYTLVLDSYVCGDANGDEILDMADVMLLINYLFNYGPTPAPYFAGDCTGDDDVDIADVVYLASFLFHGGNPPVCPF
jgi:hypothetical protein